MARAEQPGYSLDFIRKNENKDKATKEIRESQWSKDKKITPTDSGHKETISKAWMDKAKLSPEARNMLMKRLGNPKNAKEFEEAVTKFQNDHNAAEDKAKQENPKYRVNKIKVDGVLGWQTLEIADREEQRSQKEVDPGDEVAWTGTWFAKFNTPEKAPTVVPTTPVSTEVNPL